MNSYTGSVITTSTINSSFLMSKIYPFYIIFRINGIMCSIGLGICLISVKKLLYNLSQSSKDTSKDRFLDIIRKNKSKLTIVNFKNIYKFWFKLLKIEIF